MRADLRWKTVLLGALLLAPGAALAQAAPDPAPGGTPATDAVGPQELQNFSLSGSVTKPADQSAPAPAPTTTPARPAAPRTTAPADETSTAQPAPVQRTAGSRIQQRDAVTAPTPAAPQASAPLEAGPRNSGASSIPAPASIPATTFAQPATPAPQPSFPTASTSAPLPAAPEHGLLLWPWLLAAAVLAAATLFLLWRRRPREAFAGGAEFDLFVPPEPAPRPAPAPPRAAAPAPAPQPAPAPVPPKPAAPAPSGIVSTRLRPSVEIGVQPLRCIVEEGRVTIEFEIELFNAGTAPARAVLAEASLLNAGAGQEQELQRFFSNPVGDGERLEAIPPLKRLNFVSQVVAPRDAIQEYELGGRKVFVPVLAFNALYQWTGGHAQTSAAYLIGRDTGGEKLGPLGLDRGPRQIGKLAARVLPSAQRT